MSDVMEWAGTVRVYGGAGVDGEEHRRAKIQRLGDDFKLSVPDTDAETREPRRRLKQLDRVTQGVVGEDRGVITVTGTSETLLKEIGLAPESSQVRWVMEIRGCQSCG